MAIIRNDRSARRAPEPREEPEPEEEIDYSWHPNEDEFVSPLTSEQWAELLSDPTFAETDAAKAVRCLREYGAPATFQQLSIRYRGTMGRYRRWLGEAAQAAGERFGVSAPQQDQFGMDEWWPLLYCVRNTGKPGAGIQEMLLRSEVQDAFDLIEEQERAAKRAENARNLKRIEQLERARQEERERRAAEAEEARRLEAERLAREAEEQQQREAAQTESVGEIAQAEPIEGLRLGDQADVSLGDADEDPAPKEANPLPPFEIESQNTIAQDVVPDEGSRPGNDCVDMESDKAVNETSDGLEERLPELRTFLSAVDRSRVQASLSANGAASIDVAAPVDYALRYAERLRTALATLQEGIPWLSAASVARALGDESVEQLQDILNGQLIPPFAYLDLLSTRLFINVERLEVRDGLEENLPVFCALDELLGPLGAARLLVTEPPRKIAYVVDDSESHRTGVVACFDRMRCALLTRAPFSMEHDLDAVEELDAYAREVDALRTTSRVTSEVWDELAAGNVWPGTVLG